MRARVYVISLAIMLCLVVEVAGQNEWTRKPFQQWTKEEAEKVLNDSPWVARQEVRIRYAGEVTAVAGGAKQEATGGFMRTEQNTAMVSGARAPVDFTFTLRLRSAVPVRQALSRLKQLEGQSEKVDQKDRANFDARVKGLLECPACADNYVLALSSKSKENPGADAVYTTFGGAKLADIKRYLYIANEKGERRDLAYFVPPKAPGEEAIFFFPRLDEKGTPLLTPESKQLIFNVTNSEVNNIVNFRINVAPLVSSGVVQF